MIRPLRVGHRLAVGALWIVLPALVAWALAARPPVPLQETLPGAAPNVAGAITGTPVEVGGVAADAAVVSRDETVHLRLRLLEEAPAPDLLAYWTAGKPAADALPADATLLGRVPAGGGAADWELPSGGGALVLYSLAHQRTVATAVLPAVPRPEDD